MDIKIFIAVHGRHDILRLFARYAPFPVIAVCTTDDDHALCKQLGFYVTRYSNDVLADKLQAGLQFARTIPHDALLMLGSDDLVSPELVRTYKTHIKNHNFVAVNQCYLYHRPSDTLVFWNGYKTQRKGEPCGAGRLFRRDLLEQINYQVWNNGGHYGVDGASWGAIKDVAKIKLIDLDAKNILVDLKDENSTTDIKKFNRYRKLRSKYVTKIFPLIAV